MRVFLLLAGVLFGFSFLNSMDSYGQCADMNSERISLLLGDAVYDNFRMTKIKNSKDPYDIEFQVDLLKNFTYKLVFDMTDKTEGVVVKLFDLGDKKSTEEPELLYTSSEDVMDGNAMFDVEFEAPKTRMLVKYEVKDATYEGCVSFVLGVIRQLPKSKTN